jgi:hypothetical protein
LNELLFLAARTASRHGEHSVGGLHDAPFARKESVRLSAKDERTDLDNKDTLERELDSFAARCRGVEQRDERDLSAAHAAREREIVCVCVCVSEGVITVSSGGGRTNRCASGNAPSHQNTVLDEVDGTIRVRAQCDAEEGQQSPRLRPFHDSVGTSGLKLHAAPASESFTKVAAWFANSQAKKPKSTSRHDKVEHRNGVSFRPLIWTLGLWDQTKTRNFRNGVMALDRGRQFFSIDVEGLEPTCSLLEAAVAVLVICPK